MTEARRETVLEAEEEEEEDDAGSISLAVELVGGGHRLRLLRVLPVACVCCGVVVLVRP